MEPGQKQKGAQVDRNHESVPRSPPTYKREREREKKQRHRGMSCEENQKREEHLQVPIC